MSYIIQDLRCERCKQTKLANLSSRCECVGNFQTMIKREEMEQHFHVITKTAKLHQMQMLEEVLQWVLVKS